MSLDIGGSNIKGTLLDGAGEMLATYEKIQTPEDSNPENVLAAIKKLSASFSGFDNISAGFPGYVKNGTVMTAPNLGTAAWANFPFRIV